MARVTTTLIDGLQPRVVLEVGRDHEVLTFRQTRDLANELGRASLVRHGFLPDSNPRQTRCGLMDSNWGTPDPRLVTCEACLKEA